MKYTFDDVKRLMRLATGDEKHDSSTHSTLDTLWVLYDQVMHYDPQQPRSEERDRFVLSKGHGPIAYFAILAAKGFFPIEELRKFDTWEGILGGHPDRNQVPGVEVSTGSLGHGLPMAVGIALALRAKNNPRRVFALIGDGETNEGSIWESILLAGDLHLSNLTTILINNQSSTRTLGDMAAKFQTFNWQAHSINGRDHTQIYQALTTVDATQPVAVIANVSQRSS